MKKLIITTVLLCAISGLTGLSMGRYNNQSRNLFGFALSGTALYAEGLPADSDTIIKPGQPTPPPIK
jgi:hypothetical protein